MIIPTIEVTDLRVYVCTEYMFKLKKGKIAMNDGLLIVTDIAGTTTVFVVNNIDYFQYTEVKK